jgi:hypothetical protein
VRLREFLLRCLGPAAGVIALHLGVILALLTLRPTPKAGPETALVSVHIPYEAPVLPRMPALDGSYWAPPFATPAVILPEMSELPLAPDENATSGRLEGLGAYLECGLQSDESMTADERAACDALRRPFYAGPGKLAPPTEAELALERYFDHQKAIQDAPILLPCGGFTDVFCIVATALNGFDFKMGSYAAKPRPENRLAQPVFPYRPQ